MFIKPQARENVRALVGAAALGSTVGLAIGGAYLAGGLARATVVHAQIQRLAGAASGGFSDTALASAASGQDQAVLAIAKAHDPSGFAALDPKDRQVAALVDRLEARRAARSSDAPPPQTVAQTKPIAQPPAAPAQAVAAAAPQKPTPADRSLVMKASLTQPKISSIAAQPFHMRGALDQSRDLECLTQAVYYEARGESKAGQQAVAQVILNRVRHPAFPKSICGVVFQGARTGGCQFSFACDGQPRHPVENAAWKRAENVAGEALDGQVMSEVGDATHFHVAGAGSGWNRLLKVAQIGAHVFYRFAGHAGSSTMFNREAEPSPSMQPRPIFASLSLGAGASPDASKLIQSASAAVQRAASTFENAAKIGPSEAKPQPAVAVKPQAAPAAPADAAPKTAAAATPTA